MLPLPKPRGLPGIDLRRVVNFLLYLVNAGWPLSMLPREFPPGKMVVNIFRSWIRDKVWESINARLRALVRTKEGMRSRPTAAIFDSQSVISDAHGSPVGYDAAKQIKGRKRYLLIDTLGLLLGVRVTPANTTEREGGQLVLGGVLRWMSWLRVLWVDDGYTGEVFAQWVKALRPKLDVEVIKRSDSTKEFKILACRWIVERIFGWLMRHGRLVGDYETIVESAEAIIYLTLIRIQIRRLPCFLSNYHSSDAYLSVSSRPL